jgi:glycosyltransferase involved in cell wall biosynthesis
MFTARSRSGPASVEVARQPAPTGPPAAPPRPVRVAHVVGCLDRGGIETASLDICRALPSREAHQTFVTLAGWEGTLAGQFRAAGAQLRQCPLRPKRSFPLRMWRCLRSLRPDVVVSHVSLTSALILLAARLGGVPVRVARMWSEGDGRAGTRRRRAQRALLRSLLPYAATDVLGVTPAALAFAGDRPRDPRYRVLYNSVSTDRIDGWDRQAARRRWGLPADALVLGYLGRAAPEKNRAFLVDVHRAARALRPDTRLLVAGPGGTADLTAPHPDVATDPHVVLAGEVDEIGPVLAAADVLLLPSVREGLPGVILEALAAGVPVVATDLRCLRELAALVRGITLVPLSAGADAWADAATVRAALDSTGRHRISQALRSSPFTLDHVVRQWRTLWRIDHHHAWHRGAEGGSL